MEPPVNNRIEILLAKIASSLMSTKDKPKYPYEFMIAMTDEEKSFLRGRIDQQIIKNLAKG
jgi:hypothetical protein